MSSVSPCQGHAAQQEADIDIATLEQEARQMRARMERLERENERLKRNLATTEQTAETLANARLIAAAPDLLAALENVMANPTTFSFEPIRAAIAKAKGE